jgi:hypothetical protein
MRAALGDCEIIRSAVMQVEVFCKGDPPAPIPLCPKGGLTRPEFEPLDLR